MEPDFFRIRSYRSYYVPQRVDSFVAHQMGRDAARKGFQNRPPGNLDKDSKQAWCNGWNSQSKPRRRKKF